MKYENKKTTKVNYEIKQGVDGSGRTIFFIYWMDANETIEGPFSSESEAVANAKCCVKCGEMVY